MKIKNNRAKKTSIGLVVLLLLVSSSGFASPKASADPLGSATAVTWGTSRGRVTEDPSGDMWYGGYRGDINKSSKSGTKTVYTYDSSHTWYTTDVQKGADGNIWFTYNNQVAKINQSGVITTLNPSSSLEQMGRILGNFNGNTWVSSYASNPSGGFNYYLNSYSPNGQRIKQFVVSGEIRTMAVDYANQLLWFAEAGPTWTSSLIVGNVSVDGTVQEYNSGTTGLPGDMLVGPDQKVWLSILQSGSSSSPLGTINTSGVFILANTISYKINGLASGLDGNIWFSTADSSVVGRVPTTITTSGSPTIYNTWSAGISSSVGISNGSDGNMWFTDPGYNYLAKIGTGVTGSALDSDGDGLTASQELAQGTSDYSADTDNDGLSDYLESTSNSNRNSLFCNATASYCEYPSPTQRDIYIETDWMYKPSPSNYSMQPNTTQVNAIKSSYAAKGIVAHVDTGQLGGGNQVPYRSMLAFHQVTGVPDYYDYKYGGDGVSAQFNTNRLQVYHYVLLVDRYPDDTGIFHTGASYPGDDDTIVAYGEIKDYSSSLYTSFDTALAGTIFHELGHTLCLTDGTVAAYPSQPASCRFSGIDAYSGSAYPSSMNYDYQLSLVNYSVGSGSSDHDDWSALRLSDFATQNNASDPGWGLASASKRKNIKRVNTRPVVGPTVKELRSSKSLHR